MWAEVNGERKKVACGPCIRGHRSSKCDHRDRVLVEVRKPGRPLSSCPHPSGSCSCERVVINYTIPKSSECACPSERAQSTATVAGNSRIQKIRRRSTAVNPASLEKAMRATQDAETDTSSYSQTPTDRSGSDAASPASSASSTPRLSPTRYDSVSSCCQPRPVPQPTRQLAQQGGCCSNKNKPTPPPAPVKSCCSGAKAPAHGTSNPAPQMPQHFGQQFQFQVQSQGHTSQYVNMQPHLPGPASFPFGLGAPIYNHAAAAYQQTSTGSMNPMMRGPMPSHPVGPQVNQPAPEHNCHCGENCSCFGCAAHPNNATMMEYVRLMAEFQSTGGFGNMPPPLYDMPTYPHHHGYGAEDNPHMGINAMAQQFSMTTPTQMSFQASMNIGAIANPHIPVSNAWQQALLLRPSMPEPQFYEPNSYVASTPVSENAPVLKAEISQASPAADSPSDGKDEDTPTLSPSSYFWNQMVLPNCSDATGTCQCGDGCECVGCLTHGGHTGVQLDIPGTTEQDAFPDFLTEPGMSVEDTVNFLFNPTTI